ncbi:MAG: hypothetical protein CMJ64_26555 [Planctomycetaceae bacterium]|jgi:predicted kinase|nr:hypothetical protein [Planctomycetaceae bacterium]
MPIARRDTGSLPQRLGAQHIGTDRLSCQGLETVQRREDSSGTLYKQHAEKKHWEFLKMARS